MSLKYHFQHIKNKTLKMLCFLLSMAHKMKLSFSKTKLSQSKNRGLGLSTCPYHHQSSCAYHGRLAERVAWRGLYTAWWTDPESLRSGAMHGIYVPIVLAVTLGFILDWLKSLTLCEPGFWSVIQSIRCVRDCATLDFLGPVLTQCALGPSSTPGNTWKHHHSDPSRLHMLE